MRSTSRSAQRSKHGATSVALGSPTAARLIEERLGVNEALWKLEE
jgi:hypothetical protein